MSIRWPLILCISKLLLILLVFLLQLLALCIPKWASFSARTDLGKPEENGHYGLWKLCSTKGPHWVEDCYSLDTFFQLPPYSKISGIVGILHLILLLSFIPLEVIKILQIVKNIINFGIKMKAISITAVVLYCFNVIFAILVIVLASIGETNGEYLIVKSWSFWLQISIIIINVVVTVLYSFECLRILQLQLKQQIDPTGKHAETYGNPFFDAESPKLPKLNHSGNGTIAFTESSGCPYNSNLISSSKTLNDRDITKSKKVKENGEESFKILTYENESYQENSPTMERTRALK